MPIETGEIPGINVDINPEFPSIDTTILLVLEGQKFIKILQNIVPPMSSL